MPVSTLSRYLTPWRFKRRQAEARIGALRERDGERCARCRRPISFERPAGHDLAAKIERVRTGPGPDRLDDLCLTHGRCNTPGRDHTDEVMDRLRPTREADLFVKAREKRAA